MAPRENEHEARDAFLGFIYQAQYALLLLLDARDDEGVQVETLDDVFLDGEIPTLFQLKHTRRKAPNIGFKSDHFWRTFGHWCRDSRHSSRQYCLVSSASLAPDDPLIALSNPETPRDQLMLQLEREAQRVLEARRQAARNNRRLPHARRYEACEEYLSLSDGERRLLLRAITVRPDAPSVTEISSVVEQRLGMIPLSRRRLVASRLSEWWDRQVTLSLIEKRALTIEKIELLDELHRLNVEASPRSLPSPYADREAPSDLTDADVVIRQVRLVKGGASREQRAKTAFWRAREQRNQWLEQTLAVAAELNRYDERLQREWKDRHGPICDDTRDDDDARKCAAGLKLLNWAHEAAPHQLPRIRAEFTESFYVAGVYHILASDLKVGWHPDYRALLASRRRSTR